ncbi:MAG TPA: polysaccharide biosynthesis protein [Bacilli bacterium]|nr:polysaccharide biosynthesis protein [Bacilli bacterium]
MKKSSFLKGAFIASAALVITKIIGIVYVIPFYSIIGERGDALYVYGYTIYSTFLSISTIGMPLAISKVVCEYNALGYTYSKIRTYKIGRRLMLASGITVFLILFIFAKPLAIALVKDNVGLVTIEDVTLVIRVISTAIIIVPSTGVMRGYLQGHRYIGPPSTSQVVEQFIRVAVLLAGSYIVMKWLKLGSAIAVSVAVFGATAGAIGAYFYLFNKIFINRKELLPKVKKTSEEKGITAKTILLKIVMYATPFIMIDLSKSAFNFVNLFTVTSEMVSLGYSAEIAEKALGVITTWGSKLNVIVVTVASGILTSLIPHISDSNARKDYGDIRSIINQSLQILLFVAFPMAIGLSFLSKPVWMIFYGSRSIDFKSSIYAFDIFSAFFSCFYAISIGVVQSMNKYKIVATALSLGVISKLVLQIPIMRAFAGLGINPAYGSDFATICGYLIPTIFLLAYFIKSLKINYDETIKRGFEIFMIIVVMLGALFAFRYVLPMETSSRFEAVLVTIVYSILGSLIYTVLTYKFGIIKKIFSERVVNIIKERFIKNKKNIVE